MDDYTQDSVTPLPANINPDEVRRAIGALEADYAAKGIALSGRIIHVTHYLPIVSTLESRAAPSAVLSPPKTPDRTSPLASPAALPADSNSPAAIRWSLRPRRGHTAMNSGIRSLSSSHEQVMVGWTGDIEAGSQKETIPTDSLSAEEKAALDTEIAAFKPELESAGKAITYAPVWLEDQVAHGHYEGYCKKTLWPLFHYLLWQDVATEQTGGEEDWKAYLAANEAFAHKVAEVYRPGDLIWIHDYHLLLVPRLIRNAIPDAYIGLFVHTPFPSSEVFRCLPRRKDVLDGMLGANLVCFQTYSYGRHFSSSCIRVCGYESASGGVDVAGHVVSVTHCPVGIDAERVEQEIASPGILPKVQSLRDLYQGKKIIVARDKLDVVKGVLQKLSAFEKLLEDYPEWRGNVVLIQVTSPALSESPKLERQVSELVAHINGEYGSLDFIPVHHYHQTIQKDEFYALLAVADLALITPLRDGMNTTSLEFVLSQNKTKKSPLVLSEFMGISRTMGKALQVNPYNLGGVAATINQGLTMSEGEKAHRQDELYEIVKRHTSHTWAAVLVRELLIKIGGQMAAHHTPFLDQALLLEKYNKAGKRLLLFDYDGTLTPIVRVPSMALPSEDTLEALTRLSEDPKNLVYIISGRDGGFLDANLGHLKKVGFSAEHGCFVRPPGGTGWTSLSESLDMSWMSEVKEVFEYYTERTTGSFIELKKSSVTWHYRSADPDWGLFQCKQCLDLLETNLAPKRPIEVLVGKKNLEVRPIAINKGEIVKRILYQNPDAEFVFCAGDDKTDEDMFRALLFQAGTTPIKMEAPVSVTGIKASAEGATSAPVELALPRDAVFSTTVGTSSKKTLAGWHVTSPSEVVEAMLTLVKQ